MKALIADDSRVARRVLRSMLTDVAPEIEFDSAVNGLEAVAMHGIRNYNIIFLDVTMPKLGGLDALRQIRETDGDVFITMLSASGDDAMLEDAARYNASAFVSKPFTSLDIQSSLQLVTGKPPAVRVLMVDDSRTQRTILRSTLASLEIECEFDEAEDGAEGLRKLLSNAYDLVFLDVNMPRLNGVEVLREAKQAQSRAKLVMLSADMETEFQAKVDAMGADASLSKPISPAEVLNCLTEMLDVRRPTRRPSAA